MSVLSNINETSSKVKEVDRLVKVAKFEDETKLKASLVFNGEVRLRASYEDGGSVLCVVVSSASPDNAEVVFQRKMNEAEFKQHACISENNIQFRSAVSTIYGLIKHSMDENSSVRMELKVRQKKNGNSVAIFDFKFKMTSGSLFMGYATSLTFELEELKGDLLCKYLAQRLLKLEKTNERRDTKYLELKQKYFDSKNECERLNDLLDQTQREASKLRQQEGAIMEMKDQLESQYYHRNEDLGRLQEELDDKLVEYQELQNDYEKLQSDFEILLDGYNDQKAEIETLKQEIAEIPRTCITPKELEELKKAHLITKTERNELREEKVRLNAEIKKLQDEVSEWKKKYTETRTDLDKWKLNAVSRISGKSQETNQTVAPSRQTLPVSSNPALTSASGLKLLSRRPNTNR